MKLRGRSRIGHVLTIDVEDVFDLDVVRRSVPTSVVDSAPRRVEQNVGSLIDLLARHNTRATFFVLGCVAERHPGLVRKIAAAGHEVASHGRLHRPLDDLDHASFREDVRASKELLEDLTGQRVVGYRAPQLSLGSDRFWALDALLEEGYEYDSSVVPPLRDRSPDDPPPIPHNVRRPSGVLARFPIATMRWMNFRLPAGNGESLRHLPYGVTRRAFREHTRSGIPAVFSLHAWEIDDEQPPIAAPLLARMRHFTWQERTLPRLAQLLEEFRFTSCARVLENAREATTPRSVPLMLSQ